MRNTHWILLGVPVLLGAFLAGGQLFSQAPAQPKPDDRAVGRYRVVQPLVGRFTFRIMYDSYNGDYWVWSNGEWDQPEHGKGGAPWKELKALPGRFEVLGQAQGELDAEIYMLDSVTGKMWGCSARNRLELFAPKRWREITLPGRTK